jgi:WD40 repeat protein
MKIQSIDNFIIILVCCVMVACSPITKIPTSLPSATTVVPSATPTLTDTPTVTILPSETSTPTPKPTLTPFPARILIKPSAIIDAENVKDLTLLATVYGPTHSITFSQDGSLLAAAPWEGKIKLWNVATLDEIETTVIALTNPYLFSRSAGQISVVNYSVNRSRVYEDTIRDLITGELLSSFTGGGFSDKPAISSDGNLIAMSSEQRGTGFYSSQDIIIWDLNSQEKVQTLEGDWTVTDNPYYYPRPYNILFSPDDTLLAAEITDGRSIIWDLATGERVKGIWTAVPLAFSNDGSKLAMSVGNNFIAVYDTSTWEPVNASMYYSEWVTSIVFIMDDQLLIAGYRDGKTIVWDWKTGYQVRTLYPCGRHLVLSRDGKLFVGNVPSDSSIYIWGIR